MDTDGRSQPYSALAAEAEAAVASVQDPDLRRVAFEKILAKLLEVEQPGPGSRPRVKRSSPSGENSRLADGAPRTAVRKGPKAYLTQLVKDGFFKKPQTIAEVRAELGNQGHHIALTSLSGPLQSLTRERVLRRQKAASKDKNAKATYAYSNW